MDKETLVLILTAANSLVVLITSLTNAYIARTALLKAKAEKEKDSKRSQRSKSK